MNIYELTLDSKPVLDRYLRHNAFPGCDMAPANPILWGKHYNTAYTIIDDMLVFCRLCESRPVGMTFPVGTGDAKSAFDKIKQYFESEGLPFTMYMVEPEMFSIIQQWYPDTYRIEYDRDAADYLYSVEKLASLSGKKLHGKRNHINRFLENYPDYLYETIDDNNWRDCLKLALDWAEAETGELDEELLEARKQEGRALRYALEHRKEFNMTGALIRVQGKVIAFTMGEPVTADTFVVHFEKAYADIQGSYAIINREFVKRELLGHYTYVNREEDMGIPGLRHAKTSYQPVRLIEKGLVTEI